MNQDLFLALCDSHNSIIHEYGSDISCAKPAAVCLRGCSQYDHKQKSTKHQFIPARQLYHLVAYIRQNYRIFQSDFREVYLKNYLKKLKEAVKQFEEKVVKQFCVDHPISELFGKNIDDNLQAIMEDKLEDIEFSDLKCKEVFQLRQFSLYLSKEFKEEQEKRMIKILTKLFQDHMRSQKLIPSAPKHTVDRLPKRQLVMEGERLEDIAKQIENRLQKPNQLEQNSFNEIIFKIKANINGEEEDRSFPKLISSFMQAKKEILKKINPSHLTLAVRGDILVGPFWTAFFDIIETHQQMSVKIVTTKKSSVKNIEEIKIKAAMKKIPLRIDDRDWQKHPQILAEQT